MKTSSFTFMAARIYNSLPGCLGLGQSLDSFFERKSLVENLKKQLDDFPSTMLDQPSTGALIRAAAFNSIVNRVCQTS